MLTTAEYFAVLSKNARGEHDAWWLISERTGTDESRKAKLRATLQFFGKEDKLEELTKALQKMPEKTDLSPELSGLVEQIAGDLEEYVLPSEISLFKKTYIGLLPLSSVGGFCLDRSMQGERFDGYLIILNEGLYVCAQILAKAFVLENLEGDFAAFHRTGRHDYEIAIQHYLAPAGRHANKVFFEGIPPDVEGQLTGAQSSMAILILQFVLLHEFGHIAHSDFELMGEYRFHIEQAADAPEEPNEKYWAAEYSADEYSLEAICRHSRSDISRWANFLTIYVFFHWLTSVERVTGRPLCPLHPPPHDRGERLLAWMHRRYPSDEQTFNYLEKSKSILRSWNQGKTNR